MISVIKNRKLIIFTVFAYVALLITSKDVFLDSFINTRRFLVEMIWVMPVIFMLTLLIDVWISKDSIIKNLGEESGFKGVAFSFLLGSLSAGPIYAAFPICKMLLSKGASITNIVVILSAWAVIKVPMLANEARFLGPMFMILRWIFTVGSIYLMAIIMGKILKKDDIPASIGFANDERGDYFINDACIGCRICVNLEPDLFDMANKKANPKKQTLSLEQRKSVKNIIEQCPVNSVFFNV